VKESGQPGGDRLHALALKKVQKKGIKPGIGAPLCKSVHGACKELMPCHGASIGAKTMPSCSTSKKGDLEVALEWGRLRCSRAGCRLVPSWCRA